MSKALSLDLRERVVSAISAGASWLAAARFGVSASSAIRWATLAREAGPVAPGPLGRDRRAARIEVHVPLILGLVERISDITLKEIRAELSAAGVSAAIGTLWRYFDRRLMTWKKAGPRRGAGPAGHPEAALDVVRGPTRPRPGEAGLNRRNVTRIHGRAP